MKYNTLSGSAVSTQGMKMVAFCCSLSSLKNVRTLWQPCESNNSNTSTFSFEKERNAAVIVPHCSHSYLHQIHVVKYHKALINWCSHMNIIRLSKLAYAHCPVWILHKKLTFSNLKVIKKTVHMRTHTPYTKHALAKFIECLWWQLI